MKQKKDMIKDIYVWNWLRDSGKNNIIITKFLSGRKDKEIGVDYLNTSGIIKEHMGRN